MNNKKLNVSMFLAGSLIMTVVITVSVIFYFLFFEKPWFRYENVPFPVTQSIIKPGEPIPIHVARCNDDNVSHTYTITRSLERVVLPGESRDYSQLLSLTLGINPGCSQGGFVGHVMPLDARPGKWKLIGIAEIRGTLKDRIVKWESVPFTVVSK